MTAVQPVGPLDRPDVSDPLDPVRTALLAQARADADALLAEADAEASESLARARAEADAIRAAARAQGEADAAALLESERTRARRRARAAVLAAQRDVHDELRARVLRELPGLRADPAYGAWCERLRERARAVLGADARVAESPYGGVVGEQAGRRAEWTLVGLADQALAALGADLEGLWRP